MPTRRSLALPPLLDRVLKVLPSEPPIYLVGGAVRDAFLGRRTYDLDFALGGDALQIARGVADALGGAYYPLDDGHLTGRVVLRGEGRIRHLLDFAAFRGADLETDLRARDFTINAMALRVASLDTLIDPLGGLDDLLKKRLRACSPGAFTTDPLRVLRAVRLATAFGLYILPETRRSLREAVPLLVQVSAERQRDELFRMLEGPSPGTSLETLDLLDGLASLLPELPALRGVSQPAPHTSDVWSHTLHTVRYLETLLNVLGPEHDPEAAGELILSLAVLRLGRFRAQLDDHLQTLLNPSRSPRALLHLAALYHDAGKAQTRQVDDSGRIRFFHHEQLGARLVTSRARHLRLSNLEVARLATVVSSHMRPVLLTQTGKPPTRRAIYRFFRDTGPAGVDICLLSLADMLATYGPGLPQETWLSHLDTVHALLEAWWEEHEASIDPVPLVDGHDLIRELDLQSGPLLGRLLAYLHEAQACGQVGTRGEALSAAREWLAGQKT